jgi:diguanylate cyclase (GGDEF)-like protein/PAS domain S-box-containing protein
MASKAPALARLSRSISIGTLVVALLVLAGWALHVHWLTNLESGAVSMKPNTAICIALISVALIVLSFCPLAQNSRRVVDGLIAVVLLICVATIVEYVLGLNLGVDQAIFRDYNGGANPGRMGPNTAVALLMLALGTALVAREVDAKATIGHFFTITAAVIALVSIFGYIYDAAEFYKLQFATGMAPLTAVCILALCGALFWASQNRGFMTVINSENAAGFLVRRLLPPIVIVPVFLGWLCLQGQQRNMFDVEAGVCLLVTANVITLGVLIAVNSRVLFRADKARELSQQQLRENIASVEQQIAERTAELRDTAQRLAVSEQRFALAVEGAENGILDVDLVTGKVICSARWRSMLGLSGDEPIDSRTALWELGHPDDRDRISSLAAEHYKGITPNISAEVRMRRHDGTYRWMLTRGRAVRDETGKAIRIVITQSDITEIKSLQERLQNESTHDAMTGLYNRRHFEDRLASTVHAAIRHSRPLSVCICDIDDFKSINDKYGHATGDRVLRSLAAVLLSETRASDVVARYGGDEFCILFPEVIATQASVCAERIRARLERTAFLTDDGDRFEVTASFGLADVANKNASQFIGAADRELYVAKAHGRNRLAVAR